MDRTVTARRTAGDLSVVAALFCCCLLAHGAAALTPEEEALVKDTLRYVWPDEASLPLPPEGWYALELGGDRIEVFRDACGVPHVFAPSLEAAFRAQGYVIMEDRCLQVLRGRDVAMGRLAAHEGEGAVESDVDVRINGYAEPELPALMDTMRPDLRRYLDAYLSGVNAYLERNAPQVPPLTPADIAANAVYHVSRGGDGGAEEHHIRKLAALVRFFKGGEFLDHFLDDALPIDVPNSPTTDHSDKRVRRAVSRLDPVAVRDFNLVALGAFNEREWAARSYQARTGAFSRWGSQAWAVHADRSATGHAMLFAGPMMGFTVPAQAAQIHLVAPGLNAAGINLVGFPGLVIGHNERVAWGVTAGFIVNQSDIFLEEIHPDDPCQYRHNGKWLKMEESQRPIVVKRADGRYEVRPCTVYRTLHGPVVHRMPYNRQAYAKSRANAGQEVVSTAAFLDLLFARGVHDLEEPVRCITSSNNFVAADADGNIGYWLSGRMPKRHPKWDPRLPTPGTGEYDWRGLTVATDLVSSVNPPEGWFGCFNNKPSVNTPGWWPEFLWGHPIHAMLERHNPIDWDTFVGINRENGEHHFAGPFFQDYLVRLLRAHAGDDPRVARAAESFAAWPSKDVPGSTAALLMNEWAMETIVELFRPDFGPLVERSMSRENLQIFGILAFRVLRPDLSGVKVQGDYLHGRDGETLVYTCFRRVLDALTVRYGDDMSQWPYEPAPLELGDIAEFPYRNCGTFWMAVELSQPVRSFHMLVPGQSERRASPHFQDQYTLFTEWRLREMPFVPEAFPQP